MEKHTSQKDYVTGFGGKFGVQKDRQDKSALGWDHVEKVEKHESQKGKSTSLYGLIDGWCFGKDYSADGKVVKKTIKCNNSTFRFYRKLGLLQEKEGCNSTF